MAAQSEVVREIRRRAVPLKEARDVYSFVERVRKAKVVMLGEASHGTHDFYAWRATMSQYLIQHHGFRFIAVEGDWPSLHTVNKYLLSNTSPDDRSLREVVREAFKRWPQWMWANSETLGLLEWIKEFNHKNDKSKQVRFFGLDLYSLFESIEAVVKELERLDPSAAEKARQHYGCFDPFDRSEKEYMQYLMFFPEGCRKAATKVLTDVLQKRLDEYAADDAEEIVLDIEQNARIVADAETYYRTVIHGNEDSWNVRDRHMMGTLDMLLRKWQGGGIVWAHNTHIGDYRASSMVEEGLVNLGGLAREAYGEDNVALVGFGTYKGHVIASHAWEGKTERMEVPAAKPGSYEDVLNEACKGYNDWCIFLREDEEALSQTRGHRAIGVVYNPKMERWGNYVPTKLAKRYDMFIFVRESKALEPLSAKSDPTEIPVSWP